MRLRTRLGSWLVILALPFLAAAAGAGDEEVDDGIDVYFRDVALTAVSNQALETFPDIAAGESTLIERSFPDAPPQISHSVEDMYPITLGGNECLDCHHPDNVTGKEDSPLPKSHFSHAVMGAGGKGEAMAWVVKGYEETKDFAGTRYECSMCHVPQATNVDTPKSNFIRLERSPEK